MDSDYRAQWQATAKYAYNITGDTYYRYNRQLVPSTRRPIAVKVTYDPKPDRIVNVSQTVIKPVNRTGDWSRRVTVEWQIGITKGQNSTPFKSGIMSLDLCAMFESANLAFDIKDLLSFQITSKDVELVGLPVIRYLMPRDNQEGYVGVLRLLLMQSYQVLSSFGILYFNARLNVSCAHLGNTTPDLVANDSVKLDLGARVEELWGEISTRDFD